MAVWNSLTYNRFSSALRARPRTIEPAFISRRILRGPHRFR